MEYEESVQDHIKAIIELFSELTAVGDVISEEDRVVYLLVSLPDSFGALVTALESSKNGNHDRKIVIH